MTDSQTLILMSNIWMVGSLSATDKWGKILAWLMSGIFLILSAFGNGGKL